MIKSDFYELERQGHSGIIILKWFNTSFVMTDKDFVSHTQELNSYIKAFDAHILIIDALDFKMKTNEMDFNKIRYIDENTTLRWILYTTKNKELKSLLQSTETQRMKVLGYLNKDEIIKFYE